MSQSTLTYHNYVCSCWPPHSNTNEMFTLPFAAANSVMRKSGFLEASLSRYPGKPSSDQQQALPGNEFTTPQTWRSSGMCPGSLITLQSLECRQCSSIRGRKLVTRVSNGAWTRISRSMLNSFTTLRMLGRNPQSPKPLLQQDMLGRIFTPSSPHSPQFISQDRN